MNFTGFKLPSLSGVCRKLFGPRRNDDLHHQLFVHSRCETDKLLGILENAAHKKEYIDADTMVAASGSLLAQGKIAEAYALFAYDENALKGIDKGVEQAALRCAKYACDNVMAFIDDATAQEMLSHAARHERAKKAAAPGITMGIRSIVTQMDEGSDNLQKALAFIGVVNIPEFTQAAAQGIAGGLQRHDVEISVKDKKAVVHENVFGPPAVARILRDTAPYPEIAKVAHAAALTRSLDLQARRMGMARTPYAGGV